MMAIINKIWKSIVNELREIWKLYAKYKFGAALFLIGLIAEIYIAMNLNVSNLVGIGTIAVWIVYSGAVVKWLILGK